MADQMVLGLKRWSHKRLANKNEFLKMEVIDLTDHVSAAQIPKWVGTMETSNKGKDCK